MLKLIFYGLIIIINIKYISTKDVESNYIVEDKVNRIDSNDLVLNEFKKQNLNLRIARSVKSDEVKTESDEIKNKSKVKENVEEICVGAVEYCNMTKEDYINMIKDYIYPQTYEWILIGTHTAVFIVGLVGNTLVCVAVYRNHSMRTVTNYFLVNLAVADFMVILFCLPATVLWDVTETWFLGDALCKILLYFQVCHTYIKFHISCHQRF